MSVSGYICKFFKSVIFLFVLFARANNVKLFFINHEGPFVEVEMSMSDSYAFLEQLNVMSAAMKRHVMVLCDMLLKKRYAFFEIEQRIVNLSVAHRSELEKIIPTFESCNPDDLGKIIPKMYDFLSVDAEAISTRANASFEILLKSLNDEYKTIQHTLLVMKDLYRAVDA